MSALSTVCTVPIVLIHRRAACICSGTTRSVRPAFQILLIVLVTSIASVIIGVFLISAVFAALIHSVFFINLMVLTMLVACAAVIFSTVIVPVQAVIRSNVAFRTPASREITVAFGSCSRVQRCGLETAVSSCCSYVRQCEKAHTNRPSSPTAVIKAAELVAKRMDDARLERRHSHVARLR